MSAGYIRLYRKLLESELWRMPPLYQRVWTWLLLNVSWKRREVHGRGNMKAVIEPGMLITSHNSIAEGVAYYEHGRLKHPNRATITKVLKWLEDEGAIWLHSNRLNTTIYIYKWRSYQPLLQDKKTPDEQAEIHMSIQAKEHDIKRGKNLKNETPITGADNAEETGTSDCAHAFAFYQAEFEKRHEDPPLLCNPKDFAALGVVIETYGLDRTKELLKAFLDTDDEFIRKNGWSLAAFRSRAQSLAISRAEMPGDTLSAEEKARHAEAWERIYNGAAERTGEHVG